MLFSDLFTQNTNVSNGSHLYTIRKVKTNFFSKFTICLGNNRVLPRKLQYTEKRV